MTFPASCKVLLTLTCLTMTEKQCDNFSMLCGCILMRSTLPVVVYSLLSTQDKRETFPRSFDLNLFYSRLCCHSTSWWRSACHPYICKWCSPWWTGIQGRYCIIFMFKTVLHYLLIKSRNMKSFSTVWDGSWLLLFIVFFPKDHWKYVILGKITYTE